MSADLVKQRDTYRLRFILSSSQRITHDRWVDPDMDRQNVAAKIIKYLGDLYLQKRDVSRNSENHLVEMMAGCVDVALQDLPIDLKVEVTR